MKSFEEFTVLAEDFIFELRRENEFNSQDHAKSI